MKKNNWPVIGLGAVILGAVGYVAHRMGYSQAYKAATTNCQSLLALNTPIEAPSHASELSGLFGRS